ncbi:hypothetical protein FA95DRAFT_1675444 [Auriscalpium vulgare]|uniref:Uncharacterized protein n=1 Tax=Auriscalpium vulgare TaxID=40419 RepID=A0ACB8S7S6_9AGAM|nr:hypothetical protein FA95DRAFT_1675444 [Auriscalpium vulgare]
MDRSSPIDLYFGSIIYTTDQNHISPATTFGHPELSGGPVGGSGMAGVVVHSHFEDILLPGGDYANPTVGETLPLYTPMQHLSSPFGLEVPTAFPQTNSLQINTATLTSVSPPSPYPTEWTPSGSSSPYPSTPMTARSDMSMRTPQDVPSPLPLAFEGQNASNFSYEFHNYANLLKPMAGPPQFLTTGSLQVSSTESLIMGSPRSPGHLRNFGERTSGTPAMSNNGAASFQSASSLSSDAYNTPTSTTPSVALTYRVSSLQVTLENHDELHADKGQL